MAKPAIRWWITYASNATSINSFSYSNHTVFGHRHTGICLILIYLLYWSFERYCITLPPRLSNKWKSNSSLCFKSFKENRWALIFTGSWILHYPNNPCMVSLPTFTIKNTPNVVKYTLHGWYGFFLTIRSKYYSVIVGSILDAKNLYLRSWTLAHSGVHEGEVWVHFIKMSRFPTLKLTTKALKAPENRRKRRKRTWIIISPNHPFSEVKLLLVFREGTLPIWWTQVFTPQRSSRWKIFSSWGANPGPPRLWKGSRWGDIQRWLSQEVPCKFIWWFLLDIQELLGAHIKNLQHLFFVVFFFRKIWWWIFVY